LKPSAFTKLFIFTKPLNKIIKNMKIRLIMAFSCFSFFDILAQDKIVLTKGDTIVSKILEVSETQIIYKFFNELDGPTYKANKNSISIIIYKSGRIEDYVIKNDVKSEDVETHVIGRNKWRDVKVADYSQIIVTYTASEIEGLQNIGVVSGEGGHLTNEGAQQQAMKRLKKKAFKLGAKVVLISVSNSSYFGTWNYQGIGYK
jgi:hypothetical protein